MSRTVSRPRPAALSAARRTFAAAGLALVMATPLPANDGICDGSVQELLPVLDDMEQSWSGVSDYTATLLKTERFIDGTLTEERGLMRFRKPNQLYLKVLEGGNVGAELLFPKPGTNDIILGRPGGVTGAVAGFLVKVPAIGGLVPYEFELNDGRLTDGQHHPLPDSTIDGMVRLILRNGRMLAERSEGSACQHPAAIVDGRRTRPFEIRAPADAGTWHRVGSGESLWSIGEDYGQDRYVILYNNRSGQADRPIAEGDRLFIPRYYAPRAIIWVDEVSKLPIRLHMFDAENRLYESYTNADLRIDVGLTDADFDPVRHGFPAVTTGDIEATGNAGSSR